MVDKNLPQVDRNAYEKAFKMDVKKHIDAIASKYIIPGVTSDQAIMFLPAEALFAEINAYHNDLVEYAHKKEGYGFVLLLLLLVHLLLLKYYLRIWKEINMLVLYMMNLINLV